MLNNTISNTDDRIDSRDVIARIDELESEQSDLMGDWDGLSELDMPPGLKEWEEANAHELDTLRELAEEASGYAPDWQYGETLIRDSDFEEYAQELAEDCGMIPAGATWPCTCIDWEQAARELRMDYTAVDFDGVTYWVR
jgi:antirestriction protein